MALGECKECGNTVSSRAKHCPNCGVPISYQDSATTGCLLIVIGFFAILLGYAVFGHLF